MVKLFQVPPQSISISIGGEKNDFSGHQACIASVFQVQIPALFAFIH